MTPPAIARVNEMDSLHFDRTRPSAQITEVGAALTDETSLGLEYKYSTGLQQHAGLGPGLHKLRCPLRPETQRNSRFLPKRLLDVPKQDVLLFWRAQYTSLGFQCLTGQTANILRLPKTQGTTNH